MRRGRGRGRRDLPCRHQARRRQHPRQWRTGAQCLRARQDGRARRRRAPTRRSTASAGRRASAAATSAGARSSARSADAGFVRLLPFPPDQRADQLSRICRQTPRPQRAILVRYPASKIRLGELRGKDIMTIKRRDLLTGGAGIAAGMAAAGLSGPAQAQGTAIKWDREADVVVIGSGATGPPAAIVAREGGSSVILVEAQNPYRRPRHLQRRQRAARRRHQCPKEMRHQGFARPGFSAI